MARGLVATFFVLAGGAGAAAASPPHVGREVARLLEHEGGYRAVVRDLVAWHGTRHRGCVAFVATALRHVGYEVPDQRIDGPWSNPARVTFSLDRYLAAQGWTRVTDPKALVAGDLLFTDGAPDHVMVFHGWAAADGAVASVSDNQRHRYRRPLFAAPASGVSRFSFARRAPADRRGSVDLADDPVCQDVTLLRRAAGAAYLASPGEVTCRGLVGAPGAVALVAQPGLEVPAKVRLIVLDGRRRVRARADLPSSMDGNGAGSVPVLLGGGDLGRDGRIEAWFQEEWFSPMGSTTTATIHLRQVRGRRLIELGQAAGRWHQTHCDAACLRQATGEHWEPPLDPARQVACHATVAVGRDRLVVTRRLERGASVGAAAPTGACEPTTVLEARRSSEVRPRDP